MNEVLDTRYGKLISNSNDVYIGRMLREYGEFSEGEVELFRSIITKDMTVIDVGANIGAHTLVFSQLAARVFALEPQRAMYYALCGMVALNNLENVICINGAASDKDGVLPYRDLDVNQKNNMGGFSFNDNTDSTDTIPCMKIDIPCNFLKIDVEGMEREVLVGATDMIRQYKPILYLENDREEKSVALINYIEEIGYHPYWHFPAFFNPRNFKGSTRDIFPQMGSVNMLCAPHGVEVPLPLAVAGEWISGKGPSWREEAA